MLFLAMVAMARVPRVEDACWHREPRVARVARRERQRPRRLAPRGEASPAQRGDGCPG